MSNVPVIELPPGYNSRDYWIVDVKGVEWTFVVQKLLTSVEQNVPPHDDLSIIYYEYNNEKDRIRYYIRKAYVEAAELGRVTGKSVESIRSSGVITLRVKENPALPRPTVEYWGRA